MNPLRHRLTTRFFLLLVLAGLGVALIYLPGKVYEQYERAMKLGDLWGKVYLAAVGAGAVMLGGATLAITVRLWRSTRRKTQRKVQQAKNPSELTADQRREELETNLAEVSDLQHDQSVDPLVRQSLSPLVNQIEEKQQAQTLEIVAFGTISSGKSSLLNALAGRSLFVTDPRGGTTTRRNHIEWAGHNKVILVDTPGLDEIDGQTRHAVAAEAARDADLVILVMDGPLRDSEHHLLEQLRQMEKRVLICLNKSDWYTTTDQEKLLGQIRQQLSGLVAADDVLAVRAAPGERTRVRVTAGGAEIEERVPTEPKIDNLAQRMIQISKKEGNDILLANLLLQSRGLLDKARQSAQESLDARAWEIVDRYMWGAGGAAALSPFPFVDLAAGCAISSKMVLDLAKVYRQSMDTDIAVSLLGEQGKNLIGVLGAQVATPAVASVIASMLKTVPGVGTISGGLLQGVVQALITRWIGAVFIQYFRDEMKTPPGGLAAIARREWDKITTVSELRKLLRKVRTKIHEEEPDA
jgi:small GTP-binding protein